MLNKVTMSTLPDFRIYEKRSVFKSTSERLTEFHRHPRAFAKLTPPPIFVQIHRDDRTSLTAGEIEFTLWFGPIPVRWIAQHEAGPTEHSFADRLTYGPLAYWRHEHIFEPLDDGVALVDRITFAHKPGLRGVMTRLTFDGIPLRLLFFYRHLRTRLSLRT